MSKATADAVTLRDAADELDRLWRLDAIHGACDSLGGCEYVRRSAAPRLRALADQFDPPLGEFDFAADLKAAYPHLSEDGAVIQLEWDSGIPRDTIALYLDGLTPGPRDAAKIAAAADVRAERAKLKLGPETGAAW